MSDIDRLFREAWEVAEHVGMTFEDPDRTYETTKDKEEFIGDLLDYIYWLNDDNEPVTKVVNAKINDRVVNFYRAASDQYGV
jgi:hypothetical protein